MVDELVTRSGEELECESCHGGSFTTPEWNAKVILRTERIPPHEAPKKP